MPFYEYGPKSGNCDICHGRFADLQRLADPPHQKCPTCQQEVTRLVSLPSVPVFRSVEQHLSTQLKTQKRKPTPQVSVDLKKSDLESKSTQSKQLTTESTHSSHAHHDCQTLGCFKTAERLLNKK